MVPASVALDELHVVAFAARSAAEANTTCEIDQGQTLSKNSIAASVHK